MGSAILEVFGATQWQFIFYVNIPICIIVLILGVKRLPNAQAEKTGPLDSLGILILTLMTLSLMYGLKNIDFFDFSTSIASTDVWPFLVAFVVLLPLFVLRERRAADPILNLKYFTNANIVIAFLCAVISGIAMMGTIFFPQFCENAMMMKSGSGGYFIALLGVGSGVGAMMSGKLIDKHGVKPVLAMGFIGVAIGSIFMAFVACTWPSLLTVCATMIITGLGLGFTMGTPLNYTDEKESNSALAALSLVRSIGTAIAPAIMVAFVVHASAYLQGNLMDAMPSEVDVSELPHAAELDSELASLRETENGAKMLEGVDIPSLEDYRTIDVGMDSASGNGSFEMSDETLEQLKNSDVTTVVSACKALSSEMFDAMKPTIEGNIQGGFDKGIASMQEGLDSMNAQMSRVPAPAAAAMATQRDELQTVVSQMEEARDAVPAMLDEAKENYLTKVDNDAAEIQEAYQQTMNSGFKGMSLFVAVCSIVGLVLLVPYKDKKRLAQSGK